MKKLILALVLFSSLCAAENNQEVQVVNASRFADTCNVGMLGALGLVKPIIIGGGLFFAVGGFFGCLGALSNKELFEKYFTKEVFDFCLGIGLLNLSASITKSENGCSQVLSYDLKNFGSGFNVLAKCASTAFLFVVAVETFTRINKG